MDQFVSLANYLKAKAIRTEGITRIRVELLQRRVVRGREHAAAHRVLAIGARLFLVTVRTRLVADVRDAWPGIEKGRGSERRERGGIGRCVWIRDGSRPEVVGCSSDENDSHSTDRQPGQPAAPTG